MEKFVLKNTFDPVRNVYKYQWIIECPNILVAEDIAFEMKKRMGLIGKLYIYGGSGGIKFV